MGKEGRKPIAERRVTPLELRGRRSLRAAARVLLGAGQADPPRRRKRPKCFVTGDIVRKIPCFGA
jgi:hypothetical protein